MRTLRSQKGFSLAEIIASIGVFLVVGVFVVQVFALSYGITEKAERTDRAGALLSSVADIWKSGDSPYMLRLDGGELDLRKDADLLLDDTLCAEGLFKKTDTPLFLLHLSVREDGGIHVLELSLTPVDGGDESFVLTCGRYFREGVR